MVAIFKKSRMEDDMSTIFLKSLILLSINTIKVWFFANILICIGEKIIFFVGEWTTFLEGLGGPLKKENSQKR